MLFNFRYIAIASICFLASSVAAAPVGFFRPLRPLRPHTYSAMTK